MFQLIQNFEIVGPCRNCCSATLRYMLWKGSVNVALVVLVVFLAGALGYFALTRPSFLNGQPRPDNLQDSQPPGAEMDLDLTYPNGGEVLNLSNSVSIKYKVGSAFQSKISLTDKTEFYLLDERNTLVGYIGEFSASSSQFTWDPNQLIHNAGLDVITEPTPPGQYRVLIIVRPALVPGCVYCDPGVDTLDNPYTKFEGGYLTNSVSAREQGPSYIGDKPLASDFSASLFEIR